MFIPDPHLSKQQLVPVSAHKLVHFNDFSSAIQGLELVKEKSSHHKERETAIWEVGASLRRISPVPMLQRSTVRGNFNEYPARNGLQYLSS